MSKSMSKKRDRITNPEPFEPFNSDLAVSRKRRPKLTKSHQVEHELIPSNVSSKILKQADLQQKEIMKEGKEDSNGELAYPALHNLKEKHNDTDEDDEVDDDDEFEGFEENQEQFEEEIEEAEKLLEKALSFKEIIVEKIKDVEVPSVKQSMPKLDTTLIDLYKGVGKSLNKYTAGKLPKAFKHIPSMTYWEQILFLTEPEKWNPNAMYQATRIFASNMDKWKVAKFYKRVLLPRVREDIRKNKRLHFALYQSLKKALYKPSAFNRGILFPLCESRTCNIREAVIIGSIIEKVSIPSDHSSIALMKLAMMEYYGTTSYFIKLLIEKKYALAYRAVDALVAHFMKFDAEPVVMPVIWHQSLLAFVQRYKHELTKEDKDNLINLLKNQKHDLVTPEILRELNNSRNRGEKDDDPMSISCVVNKTIDEDRFDIPDVPMEED